MKKANLTGLLVLILSMLVSSTALAEFKLGPNGSSATTVASLATGQGGKVEQCTLAWSKYPSWSAIRAACDLKLINCKAGKLGPIEQEEGIDIVLTEAEYEATFQMYTTGSACGVTITNMDILGLATSRASVAVFPTSTSNGADAGYVHSKHTGKLPPKGMVFYGLKGSVSEYTFIRGIETLGGNPGDYTFKNRGPEVLVQQLSRGRKKVDLAGVLWNPEGIQVRLTRGTTVRVGFSSAQFSGEIVDMVVVGADVYKTDRGQRFSRALARAFYEVSKRLAKGDKAAMKKLKLRFSRSIRLDQMPQVLRETEFYGTPKAGVNQFGQMMPGTMRTVLRVTDMMGTTKPGEHPTIAYGEGKPAQLIFTTNVMSAVKK